MKNLIYFLLALALTFAFSNCEKEPAAEPIDDVLILDPSEPTDFVVETEVAPDQIRAVSFNLRDAGYMPTFIDGFVHRAGNSTQQYSETMFNIVFSENTGDIEWQLFTDLNEQQLLSKFANYLADGFRTLHLESYMEEDKRRYAVIFAEGSSFGQYYVIGEKQADYQPVFEAKVGQGYRLVNRSILHMDGKKYVTALFDKKMVGSWVAFSNLGEAAVQAKMETNKDAGRMAAYLDIAQVNTTHDILYSPIFNSEPHEAWYALNKLGEDELKEELEKAKSNGYEVSFICGYDKPGLINGNEVNFLQYAVGFKK